MSDKPTGNGADNLEPALRARLGAVLNHAINALNDGSAQAKLPSQDFDKFRDLVSNALASSRQFFRNLMDPRRDIDDECGYPRTGEGINIETYRQLYDREAIATRVCQLLPKECWQVSPTVYEDEDSDEPTEFEDAWDQVGVGLMGERSWHLDEEGSIIWDYLLRLDILSGIGHFGVLLLGLDDGLRLDQPVEGSLGVTVNSSSVDIPKLRRLGEVLARHRDPSPMPGYSQIYLQVGTGKVWYEGGDGDDDGFAELVKQTLGQAHGVTSVVYEAEVSPKEEDNWKQIYPRLDTSPVGNYHMPDSYMTKDEEDSLLAEKRTRKVWNLNKREWYDVPDIAINKGELFVINQMAKQREIVLNKAKDLKGGDGFGASYDLGGNPKDLDARGGLDTVPSPQDSAGLGLTPYGAGAMGAQGTDQQYFGVQFGPSEKPSDKAGKKRRKLLFLRPFDESLIQIVRYEWNVLNPRFGMPIMYRITLNDPREQHSGIGLPMATVFVHWTRVIHIADNRGSSEIFGVPRMRPVLNPLLDIRKVRGASAEGYWRSCFTGVALSTHPQLGGDVEVDRSVTKDMMEQYMNGLQRYLLLMGMSAETLAPNVVDPTPFLERYIEAICIQVGCPVRVFKGSERGELASSQDDASWNDRLRHRQNMYLTPRIIVPFINRLIVLGVLPEPSAAPKKPNVAIANSLRRRGYQIHGKDARGWIVTNQLGQLTIVRIGRKIQYGWSVVNASGKEVAFISNAGKGFHVEWPDLDSLSDMDKATIAQVKTAALGQYVQAGVEGTYPRHDFLTRILGHTEEEANEIVDAGNKAHEDLLDQHDEMAEAGDEHDLKPTPPAGFQDKPEPMPGTPGGPPMPPVSVKPGDNLVHPQTGKTVAKGNPLPKPKPGK